MSKIQPIKFNSLDDFLSYLPEDELKIVQFLRQIIANCIPDYKEKLAYNVPFYYCKKRILFIWPASVPWGKVKNKGVKFGFCEGYLLNDDINYLEKENRKQVYTKTFYNIDEIDVDLLKSYIFQAVELDKR